ncbi:MAG: hypothetical protein ACI9XC_000276 [Gammaproteobacteria bacterium]|jgi:hypothetical protein
MATISQQLDQFLSHFMGRLKKVCLLRGSAILTAVILVVSVIGASLAIRSGFSSDTVITSRFVLVIAIAGIVLLFFKRPLDSLRQNLAGIIESRASIFNGRIETYAGLDNHHPLKDLLAEDTLKIARENSPEKLINNKELILPGVITAVCVFLLLWVIIAGPGLLNYGVRHLLAGWAFSDLLPPQTISVIPGDEAIRRGGSVKVLAKMNGFNPVDASIHVRLANKEWQEVDMLQNESGFGFTFFTIREDAEYYVTSAGIRSPDYNIQVVDLPDIENLKLTYHYPEWSSRSPDTFEPGGDISAIDGTSIALEVTTTAPLPSGVLVLNGDFRELEIIDRTGTGSFNIVEDGQYYIAAKLGNELVRLSEDYFIRVLEDGKPDIKFTRPGRDLSASNIEEITVHVEASDDYALESMELRYSVNGGDWQSVPMSIEGRSVETDHVFFLEDMQSASTTATDENQVMDNLESGDLVSYYARVTDKEQTSNTDMYFIQVQPFDRRYSQSQQGGGAGGQGGNEQQEISQRQKEIIVSTWNLLREKTESKGTLNSSTEDNALLLSGLQATLSEQALTLAERTRARQLNADEQIAKFVDNMEMAAAAMGPASEFLEELELEKAIQPEQEALQHLLRAEAVFTDMQISFQQEQGGGGSSSSAGQDLAEMFELEMDLKKNQYETGNPASPSAQTEQADDAMKQLEELARRQEQLANNMQQQNNITEAQKWQQEMLRREAEQLQEQLERMEQSAQNAQQGQQSSSSNSSGQQSSASSQGSEQGEGQGQSQSATSRRLESAIRAMNEVSDAMNNPGDHEAIERAANEAGNQLEGAREEVARGQQQSMEQSFENMASKANELFEDQKRMEQELQQAVKRALAEREQTGQVGSGLTRADEARLASEKKEMTETLQGLEQDIHASVEQYENSLPEAVSDLEDAREIISKSQLSERLYVASEYIAYGAAPYIAGSESAVTQALNDITEKLNRARNVADGAELADSSSLDRTLEQTRGLRKDLEQLTRQGQGQPSDNESQSSAGEQQMAEGQASENPGDNADQNPGGNATRGVWGGNTNRAGPAIDRASWDRLGQDLSATARAINNAIPELRDQDLSLEDINEIRTLTQQLQQQFAFSGDGNNENIIEQEYLATLSLLEQLELRLDAGMRNKEPASVRSAASETISSEYKDAVAEYYRRLSREN